MPVYRFRTLEEARRAMWLEPGDPRIFRRFGAINALADWLVGKYVHPRGVFKFRTIEEANAHRDAWERDRIKRIQERSKNSKREADDKSSKK